MKISKDAQNAIRIALLCSLTYLAVYLAKNILSAVSPQMIELGIVTQQQLGTFSSTYFICYAVGQLINGMIGDKIKARYMICSGVVFAGISLILFLQLMDTSVAARIAYGFTGFFLSMIFGPLTKLVAENTNPVYTPRCNLCYTYAAYLGSPSAGLLASLLAWRTVFSVGIGALLVMGTLCYILFLAYEKQGIIQYHRFSAKTQQKEKRGFAECAGVLLKHRIARFALVALITGVIRTTVVFWMPVYISQNLGFRADTAATIFAAASFLLSFNAFVAVFVYEQLKRNMDRTILLAFSSAAVFFLLVYSVRIPALNIVFLVLGVLSSNCASSMLWARYCPSLRETGLVSTAAGFLDFISYMAASAASNLFANAVSVIGWGNLILVWVGLMVTGVLVMFPYSSLRVKADA